MTPLSELLRQQVSPRRPPAQREPLAVRRAAERIRQRWPHVLDGDPETDSETLVRNMDRRRRNDDWRGFYWADAIRTALTLPESDLWRRFSELRRFLITQIGPRPNRAFVWVMFQKYLDTFDPASDLTRELAKALNSHWKATELPVGRLVHHFRIFDADTAVARRIAVYMDAATDPFRALHNEGLERPHGPGLMYAAHLHFVSMLKPRIANGEAAAAKKLLGWLKPGAEQKPLSGPGAGIALNALLSPWAGGRDPEPDLKRLIQTRSVDTYGDPRVASAGTWRACSDEARSVILRWLAGETIRVFFDIVTEADRSHMWSDRKNLWIGLHKETRITEAWFALSDEGRHIALRRNANLPFARNVSIISNDRKKCLLIMKIDNHQVVEGSHMFPTWVFPKGSLATVQLYEDSYSCEQFRAITGRGEPERIPHLANWHSKVLGALQR